MMINDEQMQKMLDNACGADRMRIMSASKQLTLGEIITKIEHLISHMDDDVDLNERAVRFDFEYVRPAFFDSWRGIYKELALGFSIDGEDVTINKFLAMCKECLGKEFTGYKGGDFTMHKNSPVWVANYGNSGETGIVGVKFDYWLILETARCEVY